MFLNIIKTNKLQTKIQNLEKKTKMVSKYSIYIIIILQHNPKA